MDSMFNARVEVSSERQAELVLARKWQALAEEQPACHTGDPLRQSWPGFAWPLGLLVYHFMRR